MFLRVRTTSGCSLTLPRISWRSETTMKYNFWNPWLLLSRNAGSAWQASRSSRRLLNKATASCLLRSEATWISLYFKIIFMNLVSKKKLHGVLWILLYRVEFRSLMHQQIVACISRNCANESFHSWIKEHHFVQKEQIVCARSILRFHKALILLYLLLFLIIAWFGVNLCELHQHTEDCHQLLIHLFSLALGT